MFVKSELASTLVPYKQKDRGKESDILAECQSEFSRE